MNESPLKLARLLKGLRQADLGKAVDAEESLISKIETGAVRDIPSIVKIKQKISEFMDLPMDFLWPPEK
ncbi:MAG: helix-turn-helix transcriptional regulator [Candidatus Aminicenantales bacterium]|jgi:DNA-binding XRE family transcriptional regulator